MKGLARPSSSCAPSSLGCSGGSPPFAGRLLWYFIAAAVSLTLAGCDSGGGRGAAAESKPPPKTLLPPVGFSATADEFIVRLSWSAGPCERQDRGVRDHAERAPLDDPPGDLDAPTVDLHVRVGKQYTYEIRSKGVSATSEPVTDEVKVKAPPLAEARLEGDFGATEMVITFSGYDTFKHNFAWHFAPKCRHGGVRRRLEGQQLRQRPRLAEAERQDVHGHVPRVLQWPLWRDTLHLHR